MNDTTDKTMNNYHYLEEVWKNGHPLTGVPLGPRFNRVESEDAGKLEGFRKLIISRWEKHCELDDRQNSSGGKDVLDKPSLVDWLTNQADTAFGFRIGEVVRVDGGLGKLGVVAGYGRTNTHMHDNHYVSRYDSLVVRTTDGERVREPESLKREAIPAEMLELAKAQLLGSCPEVCPLRKND